MSIEQELTRVQLTIIGDEILSGRRGDKHFSHAVSYFSTVGVDVDQVTYIGDDLTQLTDHFRFLRTGGRVSFSFGGIGATVDDMTRQAVASAFEMPLTRHPEALALIEKRFGERAYPNRVLMADLPDGATLIPNEFNNIPGFSMGSIHCLPGFPQMAWSMMDWVVQNCYRTPTLPPKTFKSFMVYDVRESEIISLLKEIQNRFPTTKISSLPRFPAEGEWQTELGVRGREAAVEQAIEALRAALTKKGYTLSETG